MKDGDITTYNGIDLISIKVKDSVCHECYFNDKDCCHDNSIECYSIETDNNFIFKEVRTIDKEPIKIGMVIYHREVYDYREHLTVVGIRENEIEVEGDFSGGTHNIIQRSWLPFSGFSTIYDYRRKSELRRTAKGVLCNINTKVDASTLRTVLDILARQILDITVDVELNPEIE